MVFIQHDIEASSVTLPTKLVWISLSPPLRQLSDPTLGEIPPPDKVGVMYRV